MDNNQPKEDVVILVSINEHLAKLQAIENQKPLNQRRSVPSLAELVRLTGITRASLYNLAGGKYESVNLEHLSAVINAIRKSGFQATVSDLLTEHPISTVPTADIDPNKTGD